MSTLEAEVRAARERLQSLRRKRKAVLAPLAKMNEQAKHEGRDFTPSERRRWDAAMSRARAMAQEIDRIEAAMVRYERTTPAARYARWRKSFFTV